MEILKKINKLESQQENSPVDPAGALPLNSKNHLPHFLQQRAKLEVKFDRYKAQEESESSRTALEVIALRVEPLLHEFYEIPKKIDNSKAKVCYNNFSKPESIQSRKLIKATLFSQFFYSNNNIFN